MFNTQRNRRQVVKNVPPSRARRLRIEAMESRLLLSNNQLTGGNLDPSIWQLSSNDYMVIADDSAYPPNANLAGTNATDAAPAATTPGSNNLGYSDAVGLNGYLYLADGITSDSLADRLAIRPGGMTSLLNDGDSSTNYVFKLDTNANSQLRAAFNRLSSSTAFRAGDFFSEFSSTDSILGPGSLGAGLQLGIGPIVVTSTAPVVELIVTKPVESAIIGNNLTGGGVAVVYVSVTPTAESLVAESKSTETGPTNANSVTPQVGSVVEVVTANPAGAVIKDTVVKETVAKDTAAILTGRVAILLPEQQTSSDELLTATIDDLLSDDTIIVAPSDKSGYDFYSDGSPADAGSAGLAESQPVGESAIEQVADGGMIPLDVIVAMAADHPQTLATTGQPLDVATDLVGELSRVAVMEMIEGQPEPGVAPSTADQVSLIALADVDQTDDDQTHFTHVIEFASQQTGVAIGIITPVNTTLLAGIASAARHAFATIVTTSGPSAAATTSQATAEDARSAVFSQLGDEEADDLPAGDASYSWLDAAPLVVALACERAVAARKKRRDQNAQARTPRTPK